ncbi:zinc finger, GRF-type [Artemisia annua]|uniref:Zinc finger, GRF-type n=1 Tax=Artemisia annua TaxID=35608 RepID=A0A2U1PRH3_ARTAN|nr:zinc finger, GRF-type [Artemisia annua]PWA88358.1 zinc finger, GRF-type [Artemisia annua]
MVYCHCGLRAKIRTSWTALNPGRRFYSCPKQDDCGFFDWFDPPMCARAVNIIPGLLRGRNELQEANNALVHQNGRLKKLLIGSWILFLVYLFL